MLYILETSLVGEVASWPGHGPPGCGGGNPIKGVNPYGSASLSELLSKPLADVPDEPLPVYVYNNSLYASQIFRTGGSPELPILVPVTAERVLRSSNRKAWERRHTGQIIVSPMLRASLKIHDRYVPSGTIPVAKRHTLYINRPWLGGSQECPGQTLVNGKWQVNAALPPEKLTTQGNATLYARYIGTHSPEAVRPLFGKELTEATARGILDGLIAQVDALTWDGGMITSTIAQARSGTYDALTDIAEAKSTFQTIASCVVRILKAYTDTKSRARELGKLINRRRGASGAVSDELIKAHANQWLEFRYGIMPIVYSLNDAIKWYNTRQHEYFKYRNTRNQSVKLTVGSFEITLPIVTDRCFGKTRIDGQTGGLKLNPLRTALEVVPLSLLLNWVCNIGDCLSALWPPSGAKQEVYTTSRAVPKATYQATYNGEPVTVEFGYYRVNVISPESNVNFALALNVGWKRMLDAFALTYAPLKQALRK